VKVQYFGDVNDYRKYALLRLLAKSARFKIGVCWMLTPADERPDGNKRRYVEEPAKWRAFDPSLFDLLATVKPKPELTDLWRIESEGLIPGGVFVNEIVPDPFNERTGASRSSAKGILGKPRSQASALDLPSDSGHELAAQLQKVVAAIVVLGRAPIANQVARRASLRFKSFFPRFDRIAGERRLYLLKGLLNYVPEFVLVLWISGQTTMKRHWTLPRQSVLRGTLSP
jgi:hypothetical protein